jgi:sugar transferase (PEP-CTERM/EpsH1 system associated)
MKVFVILSRVPYPLDKGDKLRAYHQLKELNKNCEVVVSCLTDEKVSEEALKKLSEICSSYKVFHLKKWRIALNLFFCLFTRKPFQVMYFYQRPIHRKIREWIERENPDHIYCQLLRTAEYAKEEYNYPKTIDYQDAFSKGIERRERKARWPLREIFASERRRLISYENIIFEYFDHKTIISDEDRRYIYHPGRKDISIITNGIDTEFFAPKPDAEKKYDLVFIGNMSYPPNIETAEYIVNQVRPEILPTKPDLKILIAGSTPHNRVKALSKAENVEVSGWIDDIREAYASARIFFAPMQIGTGLQNKLLEAMSMGIPCVTSELANRSLRAENGRNIFVGENSDDYSQFILRLLDDANLRESMGQSGRKYVESQFSWSESVKRLIQLMDAQNGASAV